MAQPAAADACDSDDDDVDEDEEELPTVVPFVVAHADSVSMAIKSTGMTRVN